LITYGDFHTRLQATDFIKIFEKVDRKTFTILSNKFTLYISSDIFVNPESLYENATGLKILSGGELLRGFLENKRNLKDFETKIENKFREVEAKIEECTKEN
jgi:hypothetical protein